MLHWLRAYSVETQHLCPSSLYLVAQVPALGHRAQCLSVSCPGLSWLHHRSPLSALLLPCGPSRRSSRCPSSAPPCLSSHLRVHTGSPSVPAISLPSPLPPMPCLGPEDASGMPLASVGSSPWAHHPLQPRAWLIAPAGFLHNVHAVCLRGQPACSQRREPRSGYLHSECLAQGTRGPCVIDMSEAGVSLLYARKGIYRTHQLSNQSVGTFWEYVLLFFFGG